MRRVNKTTALLALAIALLPVACQSYQLAVMGASYHFTREFRGHNYNEINPGIGVGGMNTFHRTHVGTTAMFLKNSFGNPAGYAAGYFAQSWLDFGAFRNATGVMIGAAVGYGERFGSSNNQNVIPLAGLVNETCYTEVCLFQVIMPGYDGMSGFVAGGARYHFSGSARSQAVN